MVVLKGVYTALVTPFTTTGEVDWAAFEKLVDRQVAAGVAGVVPVRCDRREKNAIT